MNDSNKKILFNETARAELLAGVDTLADAVKITMGPSGQNVVIEQLVGPPKLTKDGVTVANSINLKDQFKNLGVQMVKEAASRTADTAGDGTTTATVLTQAIFSEGLKLLAAGYSNSEIREGIMFGTKEVIENLRKSAIPISSDTEIINVGTISANGDRKIGELLVEAMNAVGRDGIISVEEAKGFSTSLEVVDGLQLDRGYISPYFVTNSDRLVSELDNPAILLINKSISSVSEILPLLEASHRQNKNLLIVADDVEGEALKALVVNHMKGILRVCVIRAPEFGESRVESFGDLAALFGTKVYTSAEETPSKLEDLGSCKKVEVYRSRSIFIGCAGEEEEVSSRLNAVRNLSNDPSLSLGEYDFMRRRLSRLSCGVAVLRVGGATELEVKERKDRVEDALHATQAAVEEGILPGGGVALVRASQNIKPPKGSTADFSAGVNVIKNACVSPLCQIVNNAGGSSEVVLHRVMKSSSKNGYDARESKHVDMMESGIIDPFKVVRCALEHASSAASSLLSVGCSITEDLEVENKIETLIRE